jgi:hypothetical protein
VSERAWVSVAVAALLIPAIARGQAFVPEARIDAIVSRTSAVHAGAGVTTSLGTYLRSGVDAAAGFSRDGMSGRIDAVNRFHLDPFREHRWAPYAGGGLTARFDEGHRSRVFLLLVIGADGPAARGIATSLEVGLGGGGRIGLIVRPASQRSR